MADAPNPNPIAGGSGIGHNNVVQNQNVVIDPAAQNAVAQLAQQILANTNITLKQEVVKIPKFFGEKGKDTVNAFVLVLPMKWEQPNTVKSVFQWYQIIGEEGFYMKRKGEEREQTEGETERERACVCACRLTP